MIKKSEKRNLKEKIFLQKLKNTNNNKHARIWDN